jgi:hypothetical protein
MCFSSPDLFLLLVFHKVCRFAPCFMGFIRLIWTLSHLSFEIDVVELGFTFIHLFWWILVVLCCGYAVVFLFHDLSFVQKMSLFPFDFVGGLWDSIGG